MLDPVEYVGQCKSSRLAPPSLAVARMEVEIEERDRLGSGAILSFTPAQFPFALTRPESGPVTRG